MTPALRNGQVLLAAAVPEECPGLGRGDIVVLRRPEGSDGLDIKRIVGLPDEYLVIENGQVFINDVPLEEPYVSSNQSPLKRRASRWMNGPDEYFLLGDNRSSSLDSSTYGPVPQQQIISKVKFGCWPIWALKQHKKH